jgi:GntR family transcriptional repressor for pyruvate dehydrogenase complex
MEAAALFSPVVTGRVSAEIVGRIKAAIRNGDLTPGDQLPPERDLTKQLGVSRVSVRDALRMLEAHGLIEVRVGARGGAFVTAPAPKLVGEGFSDMLMLADLDPVQITEARMVFELGLLDLACARADEADVAALDEICDRADAALAAGEYEPSLSAEFHARLARATHNDAIAMLAEAFQAPLASSLRRAHEADPAAGHQGAVEHRQLVRAIADRDAARARAIMSAHLERTAARVAVGRSA